jgi:hypothetical protein
MVVLVLHLQLQVHQLHELVEAEAVETTVLLLWLAAQEGLVVVVMEHKTETPHLEP